MTHFSISLPPQEERELTAIDLQMVKQNLERLLADPEIGPKLKEVAIEATDHLIKAVSLFPNQNLREIRASEEIYLEYDEHDTWFAIADRDELSYDRTGAVLLGYDDLDELIEVLTRFRIKVRG